MISLLRAAFTGENLIGFLLMLVGIGCLYVLAAMTP